MHDEYVQRAQRDGYRSRAAYKLLEIQEKDRILRPGQRVIDLGAAPGGFSQVAANIVGRSGQVIGLDVLPLSPVPGVLFIQGDFQVAATWSNLRIALENNLVDVVLSDLSPNVTGIASVDQPRAMYLCELVLDLSSNFLKPGGILVIKVFQGTGFDAYYKSVKSAFRQVTSRKPKASRAESREVYVVGRGFKPNVAMLCDLDKHLV